MGIPYCIIVDLLSQSDAHLCLTNEFAEEIMIDERVRKDTFQVFQCLIEPRSFKNISICVYGLLINVRETILGQIVDQLLYRRLIVMRL